MSIETKLRRGTTAQHASFTGAEAELTIDTVKKTAVVHDGSTPGGFPLAREDRNQRTIDPFKPGTHSGLDFAYGVGIVRDDNAVARVNAGTVTLTDDATNYIEATTAGIVSGNTTGFTAGSIPLYTVTAASGAITAVQDDRCFFSAGGGSGGVEPAWHYGSGERRFLVKPTASGANNNGYALLSATPSNVFYWNSGTAAKYLKFEFPASILLTGFGLTQDKIDANGEWTLAGSDNDSTWTDIIADYVLGGSSYGPGFTPPGFSYLREFTNSTRYKFYRLALNAGQSTTNNPYLTQALFKCEPIL